MSPDVTVPETEPTLLDIVAAIGDALQLPGADIDVPGVAPPHFRGGPDPIPPANIAELEHLLIDLANRERASAGLAPVVPHGPLMDCVRRHTVNMAARLDLFHSDAHQQYRIPCCSNCAVGENVGKCLDGTGPSPHNPGGRESVEAIHAAWMRSKDGHREVILNPVFRLIGASSVQSTDGRFYATLAFLD